MIALYLIFVSLKCGVNVYKFSSLSRNKFDFGIQNLITDKLAMYPLDLIKIVTS